MKLKAIFLQAFLVGLGGFLGALCRYALAGFVHRGMPQTTFPVGTLVVNLLGCLLIGYLAGLARLNDPAPGSRNDRGNGGPGR